MKYFLIAGEASGDMHAARLIRSLRQTDTSAQFVGMGGMLMQQEGCRLVQNYENMAFMGVVAVLITSLQYDGILLSQNKPCYTNNPMPLF